MTVRLILLPAAMLRRRRNLAKAQAYVDSECIRRMTPYVPVARKYWHHAGKLRDSVQNPKPGEVVYTAPFARHDYYAHKHHQPPHGGNPKGRRMWFEFMKMQDGAAILRGAAAVAGGRAKK